MDYQEALNAWVERRKGLKPGTVSQARLEASTETGGGCDTCAYDYVVYDLNFTVGGKSRHEYDFEIPFADLLKEILEGGKA